MADWKDKLIAEIIKNGGHYSGTTDGDFGEIMKNAMADPEVAHSFQRIPAMALDKMAELFEEIERLKADIVLHSTGDTNLDNDKARFLDGHCGNMIYKANTSRTLAYRIRQSLGDENKVLSFEEAAKYGKKSHG